jgi:phosphatidylinositol kinase/protein kinase (PI-3  family)
LDNNFDLHLAQTTNFKTLSLGMNDEYFPVREATIEVISRFAHTNPASALPFLRKELIKALTELEYSNER